MTPIALVGSLSVVALHPRIQLSLKVNSVSEDLLSEDRLVKLIQNRFAQPLEDTIRLRMPSLGPGSREVEGGVGKDVCQDGNSTQCHDQSACERYPHPVPRRMVPPGH